MVVNLYRVILLEALQHLLIGQRGVGLGKGAGDVGEGLVEVVVVDAVVVLQTLMNIVHGGGHHLVVVGKCQHAYHKEDEGEDGEDDNLAQATVVELLKEGLFLVGVSVELVHKKSIDN